MVAVETLAALLSQPAVVLHNFEAGIVPETPAQHGSEAPGNMCGDVEAYLVEQLQRAHGHAKTPHRLIDKLRAHVLHDQEHCLVQIWHQNAVDQETGTVPEVDGRLAQRRGPIRNLSRNLA